MKNDNILLVTRLAETFIAFFSSVAFVILFFFPDHTDKLFAWPVKPHMSSLYIGAGYVGGVWLHVPAAFGKRWHRVHAGFPAIAVFTMFMLAATLLHLDRFSLGTPIFNFWLVFYIIAPFLVTALWIYNKRTDPGLPEESDVVVSATARLVTRLAGTVVLVFVAIGFFSPEIYIRIWPWTLTALTARVMAGWFSVIGIGALVLAADSRWTSWRVFLGSTFFGHSLVLVGAVMNPADFKASIFNWFTFAIAIMLTTIVVFYVRMEGQRRKAG